LRRLSLTYGTNGTSHKALSDVNLSIRSGEFVSLIGPSGCGKSTLIDVASGLRPPSEGFVLIDDVQVKGPGTDRGTVFQDYSLFPWMTTLENVCFALEHAKNPGGRKEVEETAKKFLELVGLGKFKDTYPGTLSGGMRQRASIARMFSLDPKVFLMDEPFGALDSLNRIYMQDLLLHLWAEGKERKTVLFVTHDVDEALLLSDRIALMTPSPGRIKEVVEVPFSRPRLRKELSVDPNYLALKSRLLSILYGEMVEELEKQEKELEGLSNV